MSPVAIMPKSFTPLIAETVSFTYYKTADFSVGSIGGLSVWVKLTYPLTTASSDHYLIDTVVDTPSLTEAIGLGNVTSYLTNETFTATGSDNFGAERTGVIGGSYAEDVWHHYVATYSSGWSFYVDGVLQTNTANGSGGPATAFALGTHLDVGGSRNRGPDGGSLDDGAQISSLILQSGSFSAGDVSTIYGQGPGASASFLNSYADIAAYTFRNKADWNGNTITDETGNGRTLSIVRNSSTPEITWVEFSP